MNHDGRNRRVLVAAAGILALALSVRLAVHSEARSLATFEAPQLDAKAYLDWAGEIAEGDVLGRARGVFYQAPLYPYLLALLAAATGDAGGTVRLLQAATGSLACLALFFAGRRLGGLAVGLAAGTLSALYAPWLFYDTLVQKESLAVSLVAFLCFMLSRDRLGLAGAAASGLAVGLAAALREPLLLLAPLAGYRAFVLGERSRRAVAAFVLACLSVLLPFGVRNWVVGGEWALTTAQSGPNLYIGNGPRATGTYVPLQPGRSDARLEQQDARQLAEARAGHPLSAREISRSWTLETLEAVADAPGRWLRLMGRKLVLLLHPFELPDTEALALQVETSPTLAIAARLSHWGVLLPLACLGAYLGRASKGRWVWLASWTGAIALGPLLFYVLGRYRLPLMPPVALLAGLGVSSALSAVREREWKELGRGALVAMPALLLGTVELPEQREEKHAIFLSNYGAALVETGRVSEAEAHYRRALDLDPHLAEARLNLGSLLLSQGRNSQAVPLLEGVARSLPYDPEVQSQWASALVESGRFEEAIAPARRAYAENPQATGRLELLLVILFEAERGEEAVNLVRSLEKPCAGVDREAMARWSATLQQGTRPTRAASEAWARWLAECAELETEP